VSIDKIISAWKADEDEEENEKAPENPAGQELSEEELEQATGGHTCNITCWERTCKDDTF
jgi:mersacidin/lichenicidin family type 2 lantibiotic